MKLYAIQPPSVKRWLTASGLLFGTICIGWHLASSTVPKPVVSPSTTALTQTALAKSEVIQQKTAGQATLTQTTKPKSDQVAYHAAELRNLIEANRVRQEDYKKGGLAGLLAPHFRVQRERLKGFLESLGLPEEKQRLVIDLQTALTEASLGKLNATLSAGKEGKLPPSNSSAFTTYNQALDEAIGPENAELVKRWNSSGVERGYASDFKELLQSRKLPPLSEVKEQAVLDALHQAREPFGWLDLGHWQIPVEKKHAYIDSVTARLRGKLTTTEIELLREHLRKLVRKTVTLPLKYPSK
jgi:hypothetical protein